MYFSKLILSLVACALPSLADYTYFVVTEPTSGTQWQNGVANPVTWSKGLLDDLKSVDVELARLSTDGLILVALNVPAKSQKLNLFLQDVPAADDYYLLFVNATHGGMHGISQKFSIVDAAASSSSSTPSPVAGAPTVTVSGGPNPTAQFATTFPAIPNGGASWRIEGGAAAAGVMYATLMSAVGAVWVLL